MMEAMADKPAREKHRRPSAAEMDERVNIEHDDPEAVIKALMEVDPDSPEAKRTDPKLAIRAMLDQSPDSPEVAAARQEMEYPADETNEG
jgi:hypothetical protein